MNREIYQEIILEHFRSPRHRKNLDNAGDGIVSIRNPNCGDIVKLELLADTDGSLHWMQDAQGCAASVASTSILCEHLDGMSEEDAKRTVQTFLKTLESGPDTLHSEGLVNSLELEALAYFRNIPARKLCVSLAWTCAENALARLG